MWNSRQQFVYKFKRLHEPKTIFDDLVFKDGTFLPENLNRPEIIALN